MGPSKGNGPKGKVQIMMGGTNLEPRLGPLWLLLERVPHSKSQIKTRKRRERGNRLMGSETFAKMFFVCR